MKQANKKIKLMIIENYIDWYTSDDKERDRLKKGADVYVDAKSRDL